MKFRRQVLPGDQVWLEVSLLRRHRPLWKMRGIARVVTVLGRCVNHFDVVETLNTREYLGFRDKLMPLAFQIRKRQKKGDFTIVCTARNMQDADFEFLQDNGICPHKIISRPSGNMEADGELKRKQLNSFLSLKQFAKASKVIFDDAASVRSSLRKIGIVAIDPKKIEKKLG